MDRFDAMAVLLAVVDRGGFSAAGRALRMPVTTVSRRVTDLEDRLGAKLFVRTTRQVSLTEAGVAYVAAARAHRGRSRGGREERGRRIRRTERRAGDHRTDLLWPAPLRCPSWRNSCSDHPQITVRLAPCSTATSRLSRTMSTWRCALEPLPDSSMIATRVGQLRTSCLCEPSVH